MAQELTDPEPRRPAEAAGVFTRDRLILSSLIGLVIAGLAGLAAATGWEETLAAFGRLSLGEIILLLCLSLVNYGFRALRWHLFTRRLGLRTTLFQDMRHYFGGFAMSVTPGRVGELVRMRWIRRETGWTVERTAPLVLADRAADLAAMAALLGLSLLFAGMSVPGALPVALLALIAALIVTRPTLLKSVSDVGFRATGRRAPRFFARVRRAAGALAAFATPETFALAAGLGLVGWFAEGVAFWVLLVAMGAEPGFWMAVGIFVFATLAGGLTGAPGGLGGAEAAMVALLTLDGVPLDIAVAATLIIRLTTLWFAIGIGLLVFPWAERASTRAGHALEKA